MAITLAATSTVLFTYSWRQVYARGDVYRSVERAGLTRALVLLETASADMVRIDLTRNPPDFENAPVLYGLSRGTPLTRASCWLIPAARPTATGGTPAEAC